MSGKPELSIEIDAAKALSDWKALFADEVAAQARRLAKESSQPDRVTLLHYQQAAHLAVHSLSAAILNQGPTSGDKAA